MQVKMHRELLGHVTEAAYNYMSLFFKSNPAV